MTSPVGRVPLTDEQPRIDLKAVRRDVRLANETDLAGEGRRVVEGRVRYAASALVDEVERLAAELRASRAREQEARTAQARVVAQFSQSAEAEKRYRLEAENEALRAELSVLRPALRAAEGRIDRALELLDHRDGFDVRSGMDYVARIDTAWREHVAAVRAALTGTEEA